MIGQSESSYIITLQYYIVEEVIHMTNMQLDTTPVVPFGIQLMRTLSADELEFTKGGQATASASPSGPNNTVMDRDD